MPQLGSNEKPKKEKKEAAEKINPNEVVSAYSEEGVRRNKMAKRRDVLIFSLVMVVLAAVLIVILLRTLNVF